MEVVGTASFSQSTLRFLSDRWRLPWICRQHLWLGEQAERISQVLRNCHGCERHFVRLGARLVSDHFDRKVCQSTKGAMMSERVRPYLFYDVALTICSKCFRKLEGKIVFQDGKVFLLRRCPGRGAARVLFADMVALYR